MPAESEFALSRPIGDWHERVVRRGRWLRRRRRALVVSPVAVSVVMVAALLAAGSGGRHDPRLHVYNTPPTTSLPSPSTVPSTPPTAMVPPGSALAGAPRAPGVPPPTARHDGRGAAAAPASGAPSEAPSEYTYVQVCSNGPSPIAGAGGPNAPPYCWTPDTLHVDTGTSVIWDGTQSFGGTVTYHTVTSSSPNWKADAKVYSNPQFGPGQFQYTFTTPGTYTFYCKIHGEKGTVVVSSKAGNR